MKFNKTRGTNCSNIFNFIVVPVGSSLVVFPFYRCVSVSRILSEMLPSTMCKKVCVRLELLVTVRTIVQTFAGMTCNMFLRIKKICFLNFNSSA